MVLNIFLFFPEDDNQVLNEIHKRSIGSFINICRMLNSRNDFNVFYDSENLGRFLTQNNQLGLYLNNELLQIKLKLHKIGGRDIFNNNLIDDMYSYFRWNMNFISVIHSENILKELVERKNAYNEQLFLLVNFNNSIENCREKLLVFKDSTTDSTLPNIFNHIDFVVDDDEFETWVVTNNPVGFSLLNRNLFRKTAFVQQGKAVYEEITSGNFWYLDNLHKDHYEVFNHNRIHIATADFSGNLNQNSAVAGRTF